MGLGLARDSHTCESLESQTPTLNKCESLKKKTLSLVQSRLRVCESVQSLISEQTRGNPGMYNKFRYLHAYVI